VTSLSIGYYKGNCTENSQQHFISPLTHIKLKKTSKKSVTSSGCWLHTLSHVHLAPTILLRKLKTTTKIQCSHCYSKNYHQTWLSHCDISSVCLSMLLNWQRWLGNHHSRLSAVWKLSTVNTDNLQQILQLFFIISQLLTEVLNESNSSYGSFVRNVVGSLRRRNVVFEFAVQKFDQNWSSPFWSLKADRSICGRLGGWSGAGLFMAATISFLVSSAIRESKSAIITSSYERYQSA